MYSHVFLKYNRSTLTWNEAQRTTALYYSVLARRRALNQISEVGEGGGGEMEF